MNVAVVFFSYEGSTQRIAEDLAVQLEATAVPILITDTGNDLETYTWRSHSIQLSRTPLISHPDFDADEFDLIILGTPIWSGAIAPALRSFLETHEFFRHCFALFCCYERRVGNALADARRHLSGNTIIDEARFRTSDGDFAGATHRKIIEWARVLVERSESIRLEEVPLGRETS